MAIQPRNVAVCIILSIVTCGIYALYWLIKLNDEANALAEVQAPTSGGLVIVLTIVTCGIYGLYWNYKQGERIDVAKTARGIPSSNSGILYLILSVVGLSIISYALMQNEINQLVQ